MEHVWYAGLFLFGLGLVILFWYKRDFFVYLSLLLSGIERLSLYFGFTLTPLFLAAIIGLPLTWVRKESREVKIPRGLLIVLGVVLLSAFLSVLFSKYRVDAAKSTVYMVIFVLLVVGEFVAIRLLPGLEGLFFSIALGLGLFSLYAIVQYVRFTHGLYPDLLHVAIPHNTALSPLDFVGGSSFGFRPNSGFNDVNTSAGFIILYLPIVCLLAWNEAKRMYLDKTVTRVLSGTVYILSFFSAVIALFLTSSRSIIPGLILMACGAFFLGYLKIPKIRHYLIYIGGGILILVVALLFTHTGYIAKEWNAIAQDQTSTQAHIVYTQSALREFKTNVLFGGGIGSFSDYFTNEVKTGIVSSVYTSVDNPPLYIKYLAEQGILGLVAYLALFTLTIVCASKAFLKKTEVFPSLVILTLLLGFIGVLGANLFHAYLSLFFSAVFLGVIWAFSIEE